MTNIRGMTMTHPHDTPHRHNNDEAGPTQDLGDHIPAGGLHPGDRAYLPPASGRVPVQPSPPQQWLLRAESEQHVRSRGRWLIVGGLAFAALVLALSIVWHVGFGTEMPPSYTLPLYALAFGALTIGIMEHLTRPTRDGFERLEASVEALAMDLHLAVSLMPETLQHEFYKGTAWDLRAQSASAKTGTENARPLPRLADLTARRSRRNDTRR